jgi:hypothetical protein
VGHDVATPGTGAGRSEQPGSPLARLSVAGSPVCTPDWLGLREPADAAARSTELADLLAAHLAAVPGPTVVRDLGCGTGSLGRWLAPRLAGSQTWLLHDRDPVLLERAAAGLPAQAADGAPVTARTVPGDLTDLDADALAGTSVVACSALLDLLTADEVDALARATTAVGAAALLTLSVAGRVVIDPADPLDTAFADAFDDHQRREVDGRRLLGPDAGDAAADAFARCGAEVHRRSSPWTLDAADPGDAALAEEWLRGWLEAACAQHPDLARHAPGVLERRLDAAAAGALRVEVGHVDVLALPGTVR